MQLEYLIDYIKSVKFDYMSSLSKNGTEIYSLGFDKR